jgi:phosphatidylglycerol:prolipoprotein diacylglycerol transferase
MHPILFNMSTPFGQMPFPVYGLMITTAILAASLVGHTRSVKIGLDPDKMTKVYLICVIAGVAGARFLHFAMADDHEKFWHNPLIYFDPGQGGLAVYGGLIAGFFSVWAYTAWVKMPFWKVADVMGPAVILGVSIGRIGCFFAGCCHGASCALPADATALFNNSDGAMWVTSQFPFLITETQHGVGVNGMPVYPTQLWESAACFLIFLISSASFRHRFFDGQALATVAVLYSIWRPINEHMRGDDVRGTDWFGLTTSQAISVPVFFGAILLVLLRGRRGVSPETPFQPAIRMDDVGTAPRI